MSMFNWRNRVYALLLLCAATAIVSPAQTLKTLYSFCKSWDLAFKKLALRFKTLPEDYSERQMDHSQV
jgi:hypothetical protein